MNDNTPRSYFLRSKRDNFLRLAYVLKIILEPYPVRKSSNHIKSRLEQMGITVDLRTIQRDLNSFRDFGLPITCDNSSPKGWSLNKNILTPSQLELLRDLTISATMFDIAQTINSPRTDEFGITQTINFPRN